MTTSTITQAEQLEALRANLRDLITTSGKALQDVIDETGIPRSTLYMRLNVEGSAIDLNEVHKIWTVCGRPGTVADLLA